MERATKRPASWFQAEFARWPLEPWAPIRRQTFSILNQVNRARKAAGLELIPTSCVRLKPASTARSKSRLWLGPKADDKPINVGYKPSEPRGQFGDEGEADMPQLRRWGGHRLRPVNRADEPRWFAAEPQSIPPLIFHVLRPDRIARPE